MSTLSLSPEAAAYLEALRGELADLQPEERDDLLADVEVSLVEAAAEGESLEARFGSPARFASELRAAAGLDATESAASPSEKWTTQVRAFLARLDSNRRVARLRRGYGEIAPIWWVARALVFASGLVLLEIVGGWSATNRALPAFGGSTSTALVVAAFAAGSIAAGLYGRRRAIPGSLRLLALAANVALLVLAVPVISHTANATTSVPLTAIEAPQAPPPGPAAGLNYNGAPVRNIYAYDRKGKPLYDIRLYDQNGRPLNVGEGSAGMDPDRRVLETPRGTLLFNSFPIRYFEPGTRTVVHPTASPHKRVQRVATPALKP
jgi:hypothetical protein